MKTIMKKTAAGFLVLWMIFGIFVVSDAPIALAAQSALINTSVISTETFTHGDTISVTCRAKGGSGFYQYGALYKKTDDTKWTTLQKYGSNSVIRFKPPEQVNYDICTKILDSLKDTIIVCSHVCFMNHFDGLFVNSLNDRLSA